MKKIFNVKVIWYSILIIFTLSIGLDFFYYKEIWFPSIMFTIPYCLFLCICGAIYEHLFNKIDTINPILKLIIEIGFICLLMITWFPVLGIILGILGMNIAFVSGSFLLKILAVSQGMVFLVLLKEF